MLNKKLFLIIILLILPLAVTMRTKDDYIVEKQEAQMIKKEYDVLPQAMGVTHEWSCLTGGNVLSSAVADLDGDGTLEVLVGSADKKFYCLSHTGAVEWSYQTDSLVLTAHPVAARHHDGTIEKLEGAVE